jgi:hypothetical protein
VQPCERPRVALSLEGALTLDLAGSQQEVWCLHLQVETRLWHPKSGRVE